MMRIPAKFTELHTGEAQEAIDAHSIQPYYTLLLADECGMVLKAEATGEEIIFMAEMAA